MPRRVTRPSPRQICIITNQQSGFHRQILIGIARYVHAQTNWVLAVDSPYPDALVRFVRRDFDGVIATVDSPAIRIFLRRFGQPGVGISGYLGDYRPAGPLAYLESDGNLIAKAAAEYFLQRGLRHFAFYGRAAKQTKSWFTYRQDCFQAYLKSLGYPVSFCSLPTHWHSEIDIFRVIRHWLQHLPKPVGIMAANDGLARHVLEACRMSNIRVPEEVAVIGVDNDEIICQFTAPPLTSVIQDTDRLGREAVRLLQSLLAGKTVATPPKIAPRGIAERRSADVWAVSDERLLRAIYHLREHSNNAALQPADIARLAGLSRSGLDRLCHHQTGQSVHALLSGFRLQTAQRLLRETELPLKQIARQAGYTTPQYFSRVFSVRLKQTPQQYRHANLSA